MTDSNGMSFAHTSASEPARPGPRRVTQVAPGDVNGQILNQDTAVARGRCNFGPLPGGTP